MKDEQKLRGRKVAQVGDGARRVFLREGFEGASVDDIAREARVSKATLYSYFPDKRLMFAEVFRSELAVSLDDGRASSARQGSVRETLQLLASMLGEHICSQAGTQMYRISVGEAARFPALAREYYDAGISVLREMIRSHLEAGVASGELTISEDDLDLAADQFIELSSASIQHRALFLGADVDRELCSRVADSAVRVFLAAYGSDAAGADRAKGQRLG